MKKWKVLSHNNNISTEEDLIEELFKTRNINNKDEYLNPDINEINFKKTNIDIKQLEKAIGRINLAIKNNEKIVILGDYDVDGICASAILWETIYYKYKNVYPYIPDRFTEGYGISEKTIDNVVKKYDDVKLIITVDNGIVAIEPANYLAKKNIDLIITDHHLPSENLPKAHSIVHTTDLCGAGVAWILAQSLDILGKDELEEKLELAALATVADLVPLVGLNRLIVKFGLEKLKKTKRIGIIEILKLAGIKKEEINTYQIGHMIGPRINASGRINHAIESLRLLCTKDSKYAQRSSLTLENTNRIRQKMVSDAVLHANLSVLSNPNTDKIIIVASENYPEGIVGLMASRLTEQYHKPSVALSVKDEISKGSARSITGINIVEMLRSVSDLLLEIGGHPMAAGFSIETKKIENLVSALSRKADDIPLSAYEKEIKIDAKISPDILSITLFEKIQSLSPFGMSNPEPVFLSEKIKVLAKSKIGKEGNHIKLILGSNDKRIEAIGFGMGDVEIESDYVNAVYSLSINEWRNKKSLQLKIKDISSL